MNWPSASSRGEMRWTRRGDITVVFRDSAFEDDVAKTNMTEILGQYDVKDVRSL